MAFQRVGGPAQGPLYQVGIVSQLIGLAPATLRAWERRYGVPGPSRGGQGYRLYSEEDIRTLRWLKAQVDSGLTIGRAASLLAELRAQGRDPAVHGRAARLASGEPAAPAISLADLARQTGQAIRRLDEATVVQLFQTAYAFYSFEEVMEHLIKPVLQEVGHDWEGGTLAVAVEHFATQQCLRQLWGMFTAAGPAWRNGTLVAGCAPGERHEIGLLMVVVRLRWRGWDVKYFGPELSLDRLEEALRKLKPRLLLLSASRREAAEALAGLTQALRGLAPMPAVLVGGQGFADEAARNSVPGATVFTGDEDIAELVERLVRERPS